MQSQQKKDGQPKLTVLQALVGRQGVSLLRRRPLRRQGALRTALANAYAFSKLRALSGSTPCEVNKKDGQLSLTVLHALVGRQGFEPWTLGLRVPCSTN